MTWIRSLGLRWGLLAVLAVLEAGVVREAGAQRDSTRADSVARAKARADSIAKADSLALIKELEKAAAQEKPSGGQQQTQGPTNPRLLLDISAVGDFVADLAKVGSTQEDGTRIGVREVELQVIAAVYPYCRGEILAIGPDRPHPF